MDVNASVKLAICDTAPSSMSVLKSVITVVSDRQSAAFSHTAGVVDTLVVVLMSPLILRIASIIPTIVL